MVIPPPQLNVALFVVDEAVSVSLVVVHVNVTGADILALGEVMFCTTVAELVPVHPLAASVTVTA